jgi:GntR family carbon starvation induced transcriptional regulator
MLDLMESSAGRLGATSQTTLAYSRLRSDVLAGRLAPGERLKVLDLAKALEVSPGAIREALSRLIPEQLVVARDQKGFAVAPLSIEDLEDLTDLRCEVEAIALRRSVERGDAEWEAEVLATAHRLRRTPSRTSDVDISLSSEWVERHAAFHAALVSACGSQRLMLFHAQLYEQSERYRGLATHLETSRDVDTEHQTLVDAALDRNAKLLMALMLEHMRKTTSRIVEGARRSTAKA